MNKSDFDAVMELAFGDWLRVWDVLDELGGPEIIGYARIDRSREDLRVGLTVFIRMNQDVITLDPMDEDCDFESSYVARVDVEGFSREAVAGHLRATVKQMYREYEAGEWDYDDEDEPAHAAAVLVADLALLH